MVPSGLTTPNSSVAGLYRTMSPLGRVFSRTPGPRGPFKNVFAWASYSAAVLAPKSPPCRLKWSWSWPSLANLPFLGGAAGAAPACEPLRRLVIAEFVVRRERQLSRDQ